MSGIFTICNCPADLRVAALRILHDGLSADQQQTLVHTLDALRKEEESALDGLIVAMSSGKLVGAAWAQLTAGLTAVVWPPSSTCSAAAELLRAVEKFLDRREVALAQFLVSDEQSVDHDLLASANFRKLARLAYLKADRDTFPQRQPDSQLHFQPNAAAEPERLSKLLLSTYVDSKDCPRLDGIRKPDDVLLGYREQGTFMPEHWFFVQQGDYDIGVLILAVHEDSGNWELVYMGLIPEVRGAGLGRQIVDYALWQAGQNDAACLVLAVDEANPHALNVYHTTGFAAWDHRTVYARLRSRELGEQG